MGACTTVFSVLNSILVRPLPFRDPNSIIWIANRTKTEDNMSGRTLQVSALLDYKQLNKSFSDMAGFFAFYSTGDVSMTGQGEPERLSAVPVSQSFFPLLGVTPLLGRQFSEEECRWNGSRAALLSYGFWQRRFGSDPRIVGKTLRLDEKSVTVVGVMPESFDFGAVFAPGQQIDLFVPFSLSPETDRWGNTLAVVGRLKPGANLSRAQTEADLLGNQISDEHPQRNRIHPTLARLPQHVSGSVRPALLILASAVGVVMLIVCANLSNLMLARTASRRKEMAIRAALGAGRKRLSRQLLTESLLLTGLGALFGALLALAATRGIAHLTAFNLPLLSSVKMDAHAIGFTVLIAMLMGLILGLAPAWQMSGLRLNASLSQRGGSQGEHTWIRGGLVVSEIAFACVLLVGAGLLVRSFLRVLDVQLGFQPRSAASLRIDPPRKFDTNEKVIAYIDDALARARSIPGVEGAALADALPLGRNRTWGAGAKGKTYPKDQYPSAFVRIVTDGYVKAMGMTLKRGRDLSPYDRPGTENVMLINETMARTLWPGEDPIGKIVRGGCAREAQVVGVVGDVRHMALESDSGLEMYLPTRQCGDRGWNLVLRSGLPLSSLSTAVESALKPIEPNLPRGSLRPLSQLVDRAVSPRRFIVLLLAGFAVLLASLGIYGLISYTVNCRTQEIGIRMALGASTLDVQGRILLKTLGLAGIGLLAGVLASAALVRFVKGLLYGITSGDPVTFVGSALCLIAIAALAGYLPARRASKIDPMICLRAD